MGTLVDVYLLHKGRRVSMPIVAELILDGWNLKPKDEVKFFCNKSLTADAIEIKTISYPTMMKDMDFYGGEVTVPKGTYISVSDMQISIELDKCSK